jgi:hypothetical protein
MIASPFFELAKKCPRTKAEPGETGASSNADRPEQLTDKSVATRLAVWMRGSAGMR